MVYLLTHSWRFDRIMKAFSMTNKSCKPRETLSHSDFPLSLPLQLVLLLILNLLHNGTKTFLKPWKIESYSYYKVHYGPSMMSQGKTPWKDPRGGFRGVWGVFPGERCLGKTPQTPVTPLGGLPRGSFPGTSLTVHSVVICLRFFLALEVRSQLLFLLPKPDT